MRMLRWLVLAGACVASVHAWAQGLEKYQQPPAQQAQPAPTPQPSPDAAPSRPSPTTDVYARFRRYARTLDDAERAALRESLAEKQRSAYENKNWSQMFYYERLQKELDRVEGRP